MFGTSSLVRFLIPEEQAQGICFDGQLLRKALVGLSGAAISIKKLETISAGDSKKIPTASCIASSKTIARPIEIQLTKQKDVDAAFLYEAESHLPYSQELSIVDKVSLGQRNGATQLQLFSVLKNDLQAHLDALHERAIDPEVICPKPLAICHFVQRLYNEKDLHIAVHIDREETTCVLVKDGLPLMARSHPVGLDALEIITYVTEDGQTAINEKELDSLHQYIREISRILLAFQNGNDTQTLPLLFCGPVVENAILIQLFTNALGRELAGGPEKRISTKYSWEELLVYALPIGLAISCILEPKGRSVNLRKEEFSYQDKWRRWKKELAIYFSLMILLSISCFLYGSSKLKEQQSELTEKYATLVQVMEKNIPDEQLIALSPEEMDENLYALDKEIKEIRDEMALYPDVPRVSDLLGWLCSHPNIVIGGDDPKALSLESLTYSMVKRPEKGKLKEHYQVRVDLEFSAPTPTLAREFHDALLSPNAFIDPKSELKWSVHRGHFKATFFLKDKTKYPQQFQGAGS